MNATKSFKYRFKSDDEVIQTALKIMESRGREYGEYFTNVNQVRDFFRLRLRHKEHEVFSVAFLNNQHQLIACEDMFTGTIDGASVYPREVVKAALKHNAAALVFAHNHPSGISDPSRADRAITERLRDALGLVDIRVLDHVVVGDSAVSSFAEMGWI